MKSKGIKITAIVTAVVFAGILALPYLVDVDRFRPQLESRLAASLGREVHLGHMELSLLAGGARVQQISIADDPAFHSGTFLQAKSLGVGVNLLSLIFSRTLHVTSLALDEPRLIAIKSPEGQWNFASLGSVASKNNGAGSDDTNEYDALSTVSAAPSMTPIVLDRLKISNATIEMATEPGEQPTTLKDINVDLKNVSLDSAVSFAISAHTDGGKLEIKGEAGPLNRDNPNQTPFHAAIKANKADLAQITSLGSSGGLGGILNFDGSVTSDGTTVHCEGKASAEKLRLVRGAHSASKTISLRYETDYLIAENSGVIRNSEIFAGKGAARLSGTYDAHGRSMIVRVTIAGNQIPLDSIEGVLPALGIVLPGGSKFHGGTVSANLSLDGPVDRIVTSGNVQIANAHLRGFDFGSKLSALPGMSGGSKGGSDLSIVNLGAHLHISPESTHISGFNGNFSGIGSITGEGEVSSNNHLQFKMVARIANDGAVRFGLNHVGLRNLPNEIPFLVVGTTSMPVIIPDLSGMAKSTTKAAAKEIASKAGKSAMKKAFGAEPKNRKIAPVQTTSTSNPRTGFLHKLFGHKGKDKEKEASAAESTQLAAQKSKF